MIKKQTAKFALLLIAVLMFISSLVMAMPIFNNRTNLYASANALNNYIESLEIANGSFSNTSSTSKVKTPSSWTKKEGTNSTDIKAGIIDVSGNAFASNAEDYKLSSNPGAPISLNATQNNDILMINSKDYATSYGFSSQSLTLQKDSFYTVSFSAKVETTNVNGASAYLTSADIKDSIANSFINFTTKTNGTSVWQEFTFYVRTGEKDISVNLELYLGSKSETYNSQGAVFFDNCKAVRYAEKTFEQVLPNYVSTTSRMINLSKELNYDIQFKNASFEDELGTTWTKIESANNVNSISGITTTNASTFNTVETGINNAPSSNLRTAKVTNDIVNDIIAADYVSNERALFINNKSETNTGYKSSAVTFERMKSYAVSVWVKTGQLSSNGASLLLNQVVEDEETVDYSSEFTSINTSSTSNPLSNDWVKYTFFVNGNPFENVDLELQLWVGSKTLTTRGYAFFDEITVREITFNEYNSASEDSYNKKLSLSNITGSLTLNNGTFNVSNGESELAGIYDPANWTWNTKNNELLKKYSGIINTQTSLFKDADTGLNAAQNPGVLPNVNLSNDEVSNNILMIRNIVNGAQYYESDSVSLSAEKTYMLSLYAYSLSSNARIVVIDSDNNILAQFQNIDDSAWKEYKVYFKTNTTSQNIKVQLWNGSEKQPAYGYVFFDNVLVDETTEDMYQVGTTEFTRIIDFTEDNFENTDFKATNDIYEAYLWTASGVESGVETGIVDSKNQSIIPEDIDATDINKSKVLFINSVNDVNCSLTSKTVYTLAENGYYKIVVRLKTFNLAQEEVNAKTDSKGNEIPYGVYLSLTNIDKQFKAINTETNIGSEWTDYTFFISNGATATTTQIVISLGSEDALTSGSVCVEKTTFETIDETEYEEGIEVLESNYAPNNVLNVKVSEKAPEEDSEESAPKNNANNFGLIDMAGIILGVALLIAIVGTFVKRALKNKKRKVKVSKTYDRNYDKSMEEKIDKHQARLNELDAELNIIDRELSELKANIYEAQQNLNNASKLDAPKYEREVASLTEKLNVIRDNKEAVEREKLGIQEIVEEERQKLLERTQKHKNK